MAAAALAMPLPATAQADSTLSQTPSQAPSETLSQAPSTPADLQGATILDVARYRPTVPLAGCGPRALPQSTSDPALDPPLASALAHAQAYSDNAQGVGLIVLKDGAVIHEQYAPGVDAATPAATASMMKTVVGLLVGIALERGMIASLDDPISRYIPEWRDDPRGRIPLEALLTMSSGLGQSDFLKLLLAPDIDAVALETPRAAEPGSTFAYNNAVSQLLGMVIERQAREAGYAGFADFLGRELWCPLGNGDARLWTDATGRPRAYAGLHAGLADWARIGELIRNRGKVGERQVVPASWIDAMARPSPANSQYGYQLWRAGEWTPQRRYSADNPVTITHSAPFVAQDLVYLDGFGGQRVYVLPEDGITIARIGLTDLTYDDAVIPNLLARAAR